MEEEIKASVDSVRKKKISSSLAIILLAAVILGSGLLIGNYFQAEAEAAQSSFLGEIFSAAKNFTNSAAVLFKKTFAPGKNSPDYEVALGENKFYEKSKRNVSQPAVAICPFVTKESPAREIAIINEAAWMGSEADANHEWIEIKNISPDEVNLSGWQLTDKDEQIKIILPAGAKISGGGFLLLERNEQAVPAESDFLYAGNLKNNNEGLRLFDPDCNLIDEVLADPDWPAGKNTKGGKRTMERDFSDLTWHTSAVLGGTPKQENSLGLSKVQGVIQDLKETAVVLNESEKNNTSTQDSSNSEANNNVPSSLCSQENLNAPSREILINEVAWAGTASNKTSDEWIELKNNSGSPINLNGWQILNKDGSIKLIFGSGGNLSGGGYFLLERTDDNAVPGVSADKFFTGAIKNSDESLRLFDNNCRLIDEILADLGGEKNWPAGSASPDYRSAERGSDLSWHTYSGSGNGGIFGTPKTQNSETDGNQNNLPPPPPPPPTNHVLSVSKTGSGNGVITSNPAGINCGSDCSENYEAGIQVILTANPDSGTTFEGWSGECSGSGECVVTMNSGKSVSAVFNLIPPPPPTPLEVKITEIMYDLSGADAGREWIEVLNSGSEPVDFTGWRFFEADTNHNLTVVQGSAVLSAGARAVIVADSEKFLVDWSGYGGTIFDSSFSLNNTGETIALKNGADIVDEVTYTSETGGSGDGNSLQKIGGVWIAAAPTPGQ